MNTIEQMARALHRAHYERGRRLYPSDAWEGLDRFEREPWLFSARAALEALREPSEGMVFAGGQVRYPTASIRASRTFTAMIDQALSEGDA